MWYGLCTQQAKSEAETFSNRQNANRISTTVKSIAIREALRKTEQNARDEALWKQMKRDFPRC